jgi:dihydroxyacid dehydratase/phosphogluconate dehydratase
MEDFYYAGGLPVVIKEMSEILRKDTISANGKSIIENSEKLAADFSTLTLENERGFQNKAIQFCAMLPPQFKRKP